MSSSLNYCIVKMKEDLNIHKKYFKNFILNYFVQKVRKIKSLHFFSEKKFSKKIIKNISSFQLTKNNFKL